MPLESAFHKVLHRCPLCGEIPSLHWCDGYQVNCRCGMNYTPRLFGDAAGIETVRRWNAVTHGVIRPQRLDDIPA